MLITDDWYWGSALKKHIKNVFLTLNLLFPINQKNTFYRMQFSYILFKHVHSNFCIKMNSNTFILFCGKMCSVLCCEFIYVPSILDILKMVTILCATKFLQFIYNARSENRTNSLPLHNMLHNFAFRKFRPEVNSIN